MCLIFHTFSRIFRALERAHVRRLYATISVRFRVLYRAVCTQRARKRDRIVGIGFLCWLLFTLAVYALPVFVGVTTGAWAYGTGAGPIGAFIVGMAATGATLAVGQFTFTFVRPVWARLAVALLFAAPASVAG